MYLSGGLKLTQITDVKNYFSIYSMSGVLGAACSASPVVKVGTME